MPSEERDNSTRLFQLLLHLVKDVVPEALRVHLLFAILWCARRLSVLAVGKDVME